jgi:hypothetical protein
MRPLCSLPIAVLALFLCASVLLAASDKPPKKPAKKASNNKGHIEGTKWTSEATTVKGINIRAGLLKLEFGKDGSLVYVAGAQRLTGKYTLGEGDSVTLHLDKELAGRKDHKEKIVIKKDKLTMTDSDGTSLTFVKAK